LRFLFPQQFYKVRADEAVRSGYKNTSISQVHRIRMSAAHLRKTTDLAPRIELISYDNWFGCLMELVRLPDGRMEALLEAR
jgi:hypothetical protein